ncbi:lysozyme family protein [Rossellomorea yichunensis]|uniref:lysozyme family protein n=1 Tax=Rossellomorea yichunensis TaxID=3077331 RepID=UPI0028DFAB56|nr:lysozyme family protein [Rossellomorea sp. YC4-1]MDT9027505.1 lysozyme family protein [Rossellomorea sp. YC4-1]
MNKVIYIVLALFIGLIGVFAGLIFLVVSDSEKEQEPGFISENGTALVSEQVKRYESLIRKYAKKEGIEQYTELIMALMQQESAGRGLDPMQSSESLCGRIGCIVSPEKSIEQGVKVFKRTLQAAGGDIYLALQSYNFGSGFIGYVKDRGGKYTKELAVEFSQYMMTQVSNPENYTCIRAEAKPLGACYGDIGYIEAVMKYYNGGAGEVVQTGKKGEWSFPLKVVQITSSFGWRSDPGTGEKQFHQGIDFDCSTGDPIYSVKDGEVIVSGNGGTYGNLVIVKHGKGQYSAYAHLNSLETRAGNEVKRGQQVGTCGNTGYSFGSHLHFEHRVKYEPVKRLDNFQDPKFILGL